MKSLLITLAVVWMSQFGFSQFQVQEMTFYHDGRPYDGKLVVYRLSLDPVTGYSAINYSETFTNRVQGQVVHVGPSALYENLDCQLSLDAFQCKLSGSRIYSKALGGGKYALYVGPNRFADDLSLEIK